MSQLVAAIVAIAVASIAAGGAILAAWISAKTLSEARSAKEEVSTQNGTTLGATVEKLQADLAEQRPLLEWARIKRAEELLGRHVERGTDIHRAEAILYDKLDEGKGT